MSNIKIYTILFLILANMGLAFGIIWVEHLTRSQFREMQFYSNKNMDLKNEWKKLSIEESKYASQSRIEKEAKKHLGMKIPVNKENLKIND